MWDGARLQAVDRRRLCTAFRRGDGARAAAVEGRKRHGARRRGRGAAAGGHRTGPRAREVTSWPASTVPAASWERPFLCGKVFETTYNAAAKDRTSTSLNSS